MLGDERILDEDVLASGAGEPRDEPVVDDLVVATRQEERGIDRRLAFLVNQAAENDPRRVIAAARERPLTREPVSPRSAHDLSLWREAGRDLHGRILAPDV